MNPRGCPSCGSHFCDRIECYGDPSDHPEDEVVRAPYVMSQDYRDWLIEIDLRKDGGSLAA